MTADSIRKLVSPRGALHLLTECVVLAFVYDESRRRFCFVADFPEKAPRSDRAFVAFVFEGVTNFARDNGDLAKFCRFSSAYRAAEDETPIVVQSLRTMEHERKAVVQFWFGPNFGGLSFAYDDVAAFVRDARARQVGSSFAYFDMASGEELDFLCPFPELDRSR
jgi:hypothetical protein